MGRLRSLDESDDALMSRVQLDDHVAFGRLYERHSAPAFHVAQSVCHNPVLAEEAVQEGFLSIWKGRARYRLQAGASFRGWAMETVRNRAIDSYRSRAAVKRPPISSVPLENLPEHASDSVLDEVIERSRRAELARVLKRLPVAQAEVIALAFFAGMTHGEVAAHLRLPAGTVKGRMRLGLEKLRRGMLAFG